MATPNPKESDEGMDWVRENRDLLAEVLRHGDDPYARACALVLLKEVGTERDIDAVKREVEDLC